MVRAASLLLLSSVAASSSACMAIGMSVGYGMAPVRFTGQKNIIVWDKAHGMEHFVRDARFETAGTSLGFIAPTPSRPEVVAVDAAAFSDLEHPLVGSFGSSLGSARGFSNAPPPSVTVVERKIVAGYEASVLKASDPRALVEWLEANGYPVLPYVGRWTASYIRRGWYLTAFKVAVGDGAGSTGPVRLSFATTVPFNPYSVPAENRGRGGLMLYYVSATGEDARIGGVQRWVEPQWSDFLSREKANRLASHLKLPPASIPSESFVHLYADPSFGRPGFDDVYFIPLPRSGRPNPSRIFGALSLGLFGFVRVGRGKGVA